MSDLVSIVIFLGGTLTFLASLLYLRGYLRFRKDTAGLFRWTPEPRPQSSQEPLRSQTAGEPARVVVGPEAASDIDGDKDGPNGRLKPVAIIEGPRGQAEIYELLSAGEGLGYQVKFEGRVETSVNMGEAYVSANEHVRTPPSKQKERRQERSEEGI